MSFCLHVSSSSSFLSLARTIVRTLVCTHTRTRTLLTSRFRWPRFVTMRFGSSVVPLHLVLLQRQPHTHTPLSVSSFSFSSVPFACTCALSRFRAGWRPHMPRFGEACVCVCVCNPWNQREPLGLEQGATEAPEERWPTKTSSGVRANVPANCLPVVLAVVCFHGGSCGSVTNRYSRFVF